MDIIIAIFILLFIYWFQVLYYSFNIYEEEVFSFYRSIFSNKRYEVSAYQLFNQIWLIIYAVSILLFFIKYLRIEYKLFLIVYLFIQLIGLILSKIIGSLLVNNVNTEKRKKIFYLHLWLNIFLIIFWIPVYYINRKEVYKISKDTRQKATEISKENKESRVSPDGIAMLDWENIMIKEIMIPRVEIVAIKKEAKLSELYDIFVESKYSRIPVYEKDIDSIVGIIMLKDFIEYWNEDNKNESIIKLLKPVIYVPETKKITTMLKEFKEKKMSMAIVLNEYGGTSGLVTLHDIMENVIGEIKDEYDEDKADDIKKLEDGYLVSGKTEIKRIQELFNTELEEGDYETIAGYIFSLIGRVPTIGEKIRVKDLLIEIISSDNRRIHRVKLKKI